MMKEADLARAEHPLSAGYDERSCYSSGDTCEHAYTVTTCVLHRRDCA
jgi:hypothetical protein